MLRLIVETPVEQSVSLLLTAVPGALPPFNRLRFNPTRSGRRKVTKKNTSRRNPPKSSGLTFMSVKMAFAWRQEFLSPSINPRSPYSKFLTVSIGNIDRRVKTFILLFTLLENQGIEQFKMRNSAGIDYQGSNDQATIDNEVSVALDHVGDFTINDQFISSYKSPLFHQLRRLFEILRCRDSTNITISRSFVLP